MTSSAASMNQFRPLRRHSHARAQRAAVTAQLFSDVPHAGLLLAPAAQRGLAMMDDGTLAMCLTVRGMNADAGAEALEAQADLVTTLLHDIGELSGRLVVVAARGQSQAYLVLHLKAGHLTPDGRVREAVRLRDVVVNSLNGPDVRFVPSSTQACQLLASQYPKVDMLDGALEDMEGTQWSTLTMTGAPYVSTAGMLRPALDILAQEDLSYLVMDFRGRAKSSEARFGVTVVVNASTAEPVRQHLEDVLGATFKMSRPEHAAAVMERAAPFVQGKLERHGVLKQNVADFLTF